MFRSEIHRTQLDKMSPVTIYTTALCPYCDMAKQLLERKGVSFSELDVTGKPAVRDEMRRKAGGRNSVPQIWIGNKHVGVATTCTLSIIKAGSTRF